MELVALHGAQCEGVVSELARIVKLLHFLMARAAYRRH